jgi:formate--tetrahydrofolate ligase
MTNLEVAQSAELCPIVDVATAFGLRPDEFESLGRYKGKLTNRGIERLASNSAKGKLVLVTAMTPTMSGEGKTTVTVGLTQGLNRMGRHAVSATREPALGPIFGTKGGACGGGYSQVLPMEDINLFFNGDFPAVSAAHNLLAAVLDAHIHHGNQLGIDTRIDRWPRTVDMNDRALREIVSGLGGRTNGPTRETGFVITPASEVMAVLCLSRDLSELRERLGTIVAGVGYDHRPITAKDLQAGGAMTALMKDTIRPNIVQNLEGGLAFVHGGPFGNIAHGCSSIVATECALGGADLAVTEAGFGSDLGAEKFLNIVCPRLGRGPEAIVVVATVRALRHHGGGDLEKGSANLFRHLEHLKHYGPPVLVAVNRFTADTDEDHAKVRGVCESKGIEAISCDPFSEGGAGCEELAHRVSELASNPSPFTPLYSADQPIGEKLAAIVNRAYGGRDVVISDAARKDLDWLNKWGYGGLPVCVAKTQYSVSDDPTALNAPEGFSLNVRQLKLSAGAGFIVAICGEMLLMPGLGKSPAAFNIDVDERGKITGLF